jgi:hypothetical protein
MLREESVQDRKKKNPTNAVRIKASLPYFIRVVSTETNAGSQADTQHIKLTPEDNLPLLMYKFTLI